MRQTPEVRAVLGDCVGSEITILVVPLILQSTLLYGRSEDHILMSPFFQPCRFLTNSYLREEAPNSHVVEQRVEWQVYNPYFIQFSHYYFPMLSICPLMCIQCVNDYRSIYFQVVYSCFCNMFLAFVAFLLQLLSCIQFDYFVVTDACLFHSIEGCTHLMCTATLSSRCLLCSMVTNAESVYFSCYLSQ